MVWWKKKDPIEKYVDNIKSRESQRRKELDSSYEKFKPLLEEMDKAREVAKKSEDAHKKLCKKFLKELSEEILKVSGFVGAKHYSDLVLGRGLMPYVPCSLHYYDSGYKKELLREPLMQSYKTQGFLAKRAYNNDLDLYKSKLKTAIEVPFWVDNEILGKESEEVLRKLPHGKFESEEYVKSCREYNAAASAYYRSREGIPWAIRYEHKRRKDELS